MLFIDLDDFKGVNDLYGHAAGDALLVELGRRLRWPVGRATRWRGFGGDEFVVVCEHIDEISALALGQRVEEAIHEPLDGDAEHELSACVGIALGPRAIRTR